MARQDAHSTEATSQPTSERISRSANAPKWKRRLVLAASGLAVIGLSIAARSFIGTGSAEAQITNPFRSRPAQNESTAQAADTSNQNAAQPQQVQPAGADLP